MINIKDIQKRLLENPEPQEIKNIRNLVIGTYKDLEFFEEPHKYFLHKPDGTQIELPSVSGVIQQFEPPKDWNTIRERKANKLGIDPEDLRRQWRENNLRSTSNGSKTHLFLENLMRLWIYGEEDLDPEISHIQYEDGFLVPYGPKETAGMKFYEEKVLSDPNMFPIMPEAKIYTGGFPGFKFKQDYCGTFDLLFGKRNPETGDITPFLADWKGLPLDTKILTTDGWKTMGTLSDSDIVYDKNGEKTKILHLSEIHNNPCYEIVFNNGDKITADQDHRWLLITEEVRTTVELKPRDILPGHKEFIDCEGNIQKETVPMTVKLIKEVPTVQTRCIEVDSLTHTYLATEKLIVTHNTNKELTSDYARKNHQMMLPPFQDLPDEPLSHYTLQLSCYQIGLEQLGFKIPYRVIIWLKPDETYELIPVPDVTDRLKLIL